MGFPSSGKTHLGQTLAKNLNYLWLDTDQWISQENNQSVAGIFATQGEAFFRQEEVRFVTEELPQLTQTVISTGGGMPCVPGLMDELKKWGTTVYLKAPWALLYQRLLLRPEHTLHLKTPAELEALFEQRHPIYAQAQVHFDVTEPLAHLHAKLLCVLKNI